MKKNSLLIFIMAFFIVLSSVNIFAASNTSISIENVTVSKEDEIKVPIKISNNKGLCGATLTISYDEPLTLNNISKGEALATLTMTRPGNLAVNPFNVVFDGIEEDATDGVIAYLHFDAISDGGTYNISITYEDGDIVNGNLEPLDIIMINGQVRVAGSSGGGAGGEDEQDEEHDGPIIKIGEVTANSNESVNVPVYISGNTGICGTTLKFAYDESLMLTQITKGDALPSLIMTRPGNLSANPFNLVFDGIEQDTTNGLFVILTFDAPQDNGIYDITATYDEGDIVNGELLPVDVLIKNGKIMVGFKNIEVTIDNKKISLTITGETDGNTFVAFYNDLGQMTSVKAYELSNANIAANPDLNSSYAQVFCLTKNLMPLCNFQRIILK